MTKVSKEQDVTHEEQESAGSLKCVVRLTSGGESTNAELSAVMFNNVSSAKAEAYRQTEVTLWGRRPPALRVCLNSGSLSGHTSSCFISMFSTAWVSGKKNSFLFCMFHEFPNKFDRSDASLVGEMHGLMRRSFAHPSSATVSVRRHVVVLPPRAEGRCLGS